MSQYIDKKIPELNPSMTKAKALKLILDYVAEHGQPVHDVILDGEVKGELDGMSIINEWTFKGLCKYLIES